MKKFYFALLISFISISLSNAQNRFGVQVGASLNTTVNSKLQGCNFHYDLGGYFGGIYEINLKQSWKILPQFIISYDSPGGNSEEDVRSYFTRFAISVPIEIGYCIALNNKSSLLLSAGPFARYDVFGRDKLYAYHGNEEQPRFALGWWHGSMSEKLDYGIQGGVTYEVGKVFYSVKMKYSLKNDRWLNAYGHSLIFTAGVGYYF